MATGRIGTTPVLRTRWSKEPAGGTTSLSGLDDYSVSLVYEVGYEAVYQNGALLSRGNDYTATNGTSITLTNATVAGDIIEVFANNVVPLTDTYSQSVADGKFVNNTIVDAKGDLIVGSAADTFTRLAVGSANQVLTVDSSTATGLKWAAPAGGESWSLVSSGTIAASGTNLTSLSGYKYYYIYCWGMSTTSNENVGIRFNSDTTGYRTIGSQGGDSFLNATTFATQITCNAADSNAAMAVFVTNATDTTGWKRYYSTGWRSAATAGLSAASGIYESTSAITSILIYRANFDFDAGNYRLYGSN